MSVEQVLELVAMGWALLFAYLPKLKVWFGALSGGKKVLVQLGSLALVVYGALAGSCLGLLAYFACEEIGPALLAASVLFLKVVVANQGAYQITRLISKTRGSE